MSTEEMMQEKGMDIEERTAENELNVLPGLEISEPEETAASGITAGTAGIRSAAKT